MGGIDYEKPYQFNGQTLEDQNSSSHLAFNLKHFNRYNASRGKEIQRCLLLGKGFLLQQKTPKGIGIVDLTVVHYVK